MVVQEWHSVGAHPGIAGLADAPVAPTAVRLVTMMSLAQRSEVVGRGRTTLLEGLDVVLLGAPGRAIAPREDAAAVAQDDLLPEPAGDLVGVGGAAPPGR